MRARAWVFATMGVGLGGAFGGGATWAEERPDPATAPAQTVEVTRGASGVTYEPQVPVRVEFRNEFKKRYRLVNFQLLVDGELVTEMAAGKDGELQEAFLAHVAQLPAGLHAVEVRAELAGKSTGLFNYVENYRLHVRARRAIEPTVGQPALLTVVLDRQGGWTVPVEEQARLRFEAGPGLGVHTAKSAAEGRRTVR